MIFPALVFAYELQSPSKVCNTNSYVDLEICMTILQTASLCCWQHHFWHTIMVTFKSIKYQFLCRLENLYEYPSNSWFVSLAASFLAYQHGYLWKYLIPIPMLNHKFIWPYFKQIDVIFPVLVFAYELPSPPNVSNTDSNINFWNLYDYPSNS